MDTVIGKFRNNLVLFEKVIPGHSLYVYVQQFVGRGPAHVYNFLIIKKYNDQQMEPVDLP